MISNSYFSYYNMTFIESDIYFFRIIYCWFTHVQRHKDVNQPHPKIVAESMPNH